MQFPRALKRFQQQVHRLPNHWNPAQDVHTITIATPPSCGDPHCCPHATKPFDTWDSKLAMAVNSTSHNLCRDLACSQVHHLPRLVQLFLHQPVRRGRLGVCDARLSTPLSFLLPLFRNHWFLHDQRGKDKERGRPQHARAMQTRT